MGTAPKTVNYKGEVLTDEMQQYLFGVKSSGGISLSGASVGPDRAKEIFSNWLFGLRPKAVDPSEVISRESGLGGLRERAAAGSGISGTFGAGNFEGLPDLPGLGSLSAPMAKGVPYSVPPLPKLKDMFAP